MARKPQKRLATMSDIARESGVSQTTVSFVLNNHASAAHIPAETKERILQVAKSLSYRPNLAAKELRTNQTHTRGSRCRLGIWKTAVDRQHWLGCCGERTGC